MILKPMNDYPISMKLNLAIENFYPIGSGFDIAATIGRPSFNNSSEESY